MAVELPCVKVYYCVGGEFLLLCPFGKKNLNFLIVDLRKDFTKGDW